jgi:IS30 family transposase
MTTFDKEKIRELRQKGMGYKAIATALGLSKDSIKSYCKRAGLNGDSCVIALNIEEKIKRNLLCACCQKPIKQKHHGRARRFCSETCRRKWWNEHQDKRSKNETSIYKFYCIQCGKEFKVYGNKQRKYCSHDCYIKDRFWRNDNGI